MKKKVLSLTLASCLPLPMAASNLLPEMKKTDFEKLSVKVEEIKDRVQHLLVNPLFWSAVGCIAYASPRRVASEHPQLSIMGLGCLLSYLKGDLLAGVEGAEVKVRLLKGDLDEKGRKKQPKP